MKKQIPHDSAHKHVSGESVYVDDIPVSDQLLTGKVVYSPYAHARIKSFDLRAARQLSGVHAVLCFEDIPGNNQLGAIVHDEPCLAESHVNFIGQAVFLIAAENDALCRRAEKLITIKYEPLDAILNIESAMAKNSLMGDERKIDCGDAEQALKSSAHTIKGELFTGAQEHWYLETQAALCIPGEGKEMTVISSTQSPSETQAIIAGLLNIPRNEVVVEVRRMGGAFGGKETQGHHIAGWAALLAQAVKRPVKIRLFRDDDQIMTGKRHPFLIKYEAGFDERGIISAVKVEQNSDGGAATDLSFAILERAMLHADNAYYIPNMSVKGRVWKTNIPSNTAFRGFGGPQGMAAMETIIDRIARFLHKDSAEIRYKNFYGINERNITPYGQTVENNHLFILYEQLMESSQYKKRRKDIDSFNSQNEFYKKGLAITPVKFGISFTTAFLNQAGALVNIYQDGTVLVNHGGTEMGQGLDTKIQQIAAAELGVSLDKIKLSPTNTSKVPNTSPTAASTGTDLNGMAVRSAMEKLKIRISNVIADHFNKNNSDNLSKPENIVFKNDWIYDSQNPARKISFVEAIPVCYVNQISLSATGYYRTPDINFDRQKGKGKPFHYFAFGMAVTEVLLDTLTGCHEIVCADILHDVGDSINPGLDIGQIEGAYIQGVGWCTTEECKWDEKGSLLNHSPDTYKIPSVKDIPKDFRSKLIEGVPNPGTIRKSKAVGEPPFMLAFSAWLAIKDAVSAVANHQFEPEFSLPATNEVILLSIEKLKAKIRGN